MAKVEKEYCQRRAEQLRQQFEKALQDNDTELFTETHRTAMRYMKKSEISRYYIRFLKQCYINNRGGNSDVKN